MKRRTFEEMVIYFNQTVADMDIPRKYKMELLGMITAILQKHDEEVRRWIPVTERLPEQRARVLTCSKDGDVWINDYNPIAPTAWVIEPWAVIAWMALPESYREDPCYGCDYLGESCVGEGCGRIAK